MAALTIFPAIDLKGGQVVRLAEGDMARATVYGDDPAAPARLFARNPARNNLTSLAGAGGALQFDVRLVHAPATSVGVAMGCGQGCEASVDLAPALAKLAPGQKHTITVPLACFAWRRAIPAGFGARLLGLAALVGLQGAIGWWMVASGLVDRTDVSHFRLALHLLTALFLLAALVWTARDFALMARDPAGVRPRLTGVAWAVIAILFVQLLLGAWVAGLNAGYIASTWPSMNDHFVPEGIDWTRGA